MAGEITVSEVMRHVGELEAATTPEAKNVARSLIALKVAKLSGESMQAAFESLRPVPEKVQTMGNIGGRAVRQPTAPMKDAPLDQVVAELADKLELVPVAEITVGAKVEHVNNARHQECGIGVVTEIKHGDCTVLWADGTRSFIGAGGLRLVPAPPAELEDVPWGVTS